MKTATPPGNSPPTSILIVGAGAVGLVMGYHLTRGGAAVTFMVRPQRVEASQATQYLFCYDDCELKEYADFAVTSTAREVAGGRFDYVLLTLDGAACHSTDGEALLRELGDAIRATSAILIMCGVGVGLREHILATTALPVDRLLEGTLGNASHQVSANLPVHPPVNAAKLSQASIAYRHFSGQTGFLLVPAPREAARGFAAIYDRCGVSRCTMTSAAMFRLYTNAFFCYTVASDIAGWPDAAGFAVQRDLVALCIKAMREIAGLKRFGWTGKLARLILSPGLFLRMIRKIEREIRPLDFAAFNRFHHGGKVLAQDIAVLRCCLAEGVSQRRPMAALTELLRQFDATRKNRTRMRA